MEAIKNLITRLHPSGIVVLSGFILIIYIAFGFLYWQHSSKHTELNTQINKVSPIVAKSLPSAERLLEEYDKVESALAVPETDSDAIAILVSIAEESGIDISPDTNKFRVPSASKPGKVKVGGGTYQVLAFRDIRVQGEYDSVMAFISDLDSGKTLETMVLKKVRISQTEVKGEGEEESKIEVVANMDVDIYTKPGG